MRFIKKALTTLFIVLAGIIVLGYYFVSFNFIDQPRLNGEVLTNTLTVEGRARQYHSYIPKGINLNAIIIALHGSNNNGLAARRAFGYALDQLADKHGLIIVYPDGFEDHWNDCRIAAPYSANTQNIDDVAFLHALKEKVVVDNQLTDAKAYLTGISNGGQMAIRMALEAPDSFDAFIPIIANMPSSENLGCRQSDQPVSIAFINGTADPLNPYNGGEVALYGLLSKRGTVISTDASVQYWRNLANAKLQQQFSISDHNTKDNSKIDATFWRGKNGHNVALFAVLGGGHTTPHTKQRMPRLFGETNQDIDAADLIWLFVERTILDSEIAR